jgi:hypothetical protein
VEAPPVSDHSALVRHRARDSQRGVLLDAEVGIRVSSEDPLQQPVYADGAYKPFGEFTLADVEARARELSEAVGWGPTARVAGVARGWSELARAMSTAGAPRVAELGEQPATEFARKLWVVPPGGSLL